MRGSIWDSRVWAALHGLYMLHVAYFSPDIPCMPTRYPSL